MIIYCVPTGGTALRLTALISLVICATTNAAAFQQDCSVRVPISVRAIQDKNTVFLKRVTLENFRATLNKQPAKISLTAHEGPYRFVLLLDHSGSMEKLWPAVTAYAEDFIRRLNQNSRAGLIVFNDKTELALPIQEPSDMLREFQKFKSAKPYGRTALLASIQQAIQMLEPAQDGDVIYVITEGGDNRDAATTTKIQELLQRNKIRVFTLLLSEPHPLTVEESFGPASLNTLTVTSGGDVMRVDDSEIVGKQLFPNYAFSLFPEMVYQFSINLHLDSKVKKSKLKIHYDDPAFPKSHFKVLYPETIFNSCTSSSSP